ncbi:MAG TPA: acyltransferase family protein [Chloroflexia bacterium]|nr:acyltransferase family protein [Chloroflexia bacterium]
MATVESEQNRVTVVEGKSFKPSDTNQAGSKPGSIKLPYLAGLDGLRAIAVIAVVLYHADIPWMPGGFLGVEVFFVISGYLITALLQAEWQRNGKISLKSFWLGRARRLLPALFLLLVVTLTFALFVLPDEVARLRTDALAALSYITNWYLILENRSYFDTVGRPSLLQHLWSLAVEEQFYLLWPLILVAGLKLWRRKGILVITLTGAGASLLLMAALYQPDVDPSRLYYGTDTRASGLLLGAALACIWMPWNKSPAGFLLKPILINLSGVAGLVGLFWCFVQFSEFDPLLYHGGFGLIALLTALIIATAVHPRGLIGPVLLGRQPLRWIGQRSYGIYLWHWPIVAITRPQLDVPLDGFMLLALRLILTAGLAEFSYRFVEKPVRAGAVRQAWREWRQAQGRERRELNLLWSSIILLAVACTVTLTVELAVVRNSVSPAYLSLVVAQETAAPATNTPNPTSTPVAASYVVSTAEATGESAAIVSMTLPPLINPPVASPTGLLAPTPKTGQEVITPTTSPTLTATTLPEKPDKVASAPPEKTVFPPTATPAAPPAQTSQAANQNAPKTQEPLKIGRVFAVGDSVMLGASAELKRSIGNIEVDARVGRQVQEAIGILQARKASGTLGDVVIVHVGNNGTFTAAQFDQIMQTLSGVRKVVFVNVKVPRRWEEPNNNVIAGGVSRYSNTVLVDWRGTSINHPEFFWDDGIHLRPDGQRVYTSLVASYLK